MAKKNESIQEYLARGGKITVVPSAIPAEEKRIVKPTNSGPVNIMTYEDAEHYYGERKERKKQPKKVDTSKINLDSLPDDFRKKLGL